MPKYDGHDLAVAAQPSIITADPVRHAIIAGRMFEQCLDRVTLDYQTRVDMRDMIDMIIAQLEGSQ